MTASNDETARVWDAITGQPLTEPLKHEAEVWIAQFSADGQRVVTASSDKTARVWEVPDVSLPVPNWVPQLTEAIAVKRFNDQGIAEPVPAAQLLALKQQFSQISSPVGWTGLAKWFFADPLARTISPSSPVAIPDYLKHRIEEGTLSSLKHGSPDNSWLVAVAEGGCLSCWETSRGQLRWQRTGVAVTDSLTFTPDGALLRSDTCGHPPTLLSINDGTPVRELVLNRKL